MDFPKTENYIRYCWELATWDVAHTNAVLRKYSEYLSAKNCDSNYRIKLKSFFMLNQIFIDRTRLILPKKISKKQLHHPIDEPLLNRPIFQCHEVVKVLLTCSLHWWFYELVFVWCETSFSFELWIEMLSSEKKIDRIYLSALFKESLSDEESLAWLKKSGKLSQELTQNVARFVFFP